MKKTTQQLPTLRLNLLSKAQYDTAVASGDISATELYLTPNDNPIPTKTSQLENDSGFVTSSELPTLESLGAASANHNHDALYGPLRFTFDLPTTGWALNSTTSLYEITIAIPGMLAEYDDFLFDAVRSPTMTSADIDAAEEVLGVIKGITSYDGSVQIRVSETPTTALQLRIKVR